MIPLAKPFLGGNESKYVRECLKSGWISSLGKFVVEFEEKFSDYCGCKYGVSVCNGTAALHLALKTLEISFGDEVLVPNLTFIATANTVHYTGAKPVLVDSEIETWNIDPSKIEEKITRKTKAIIVVHLYGHPARMDDILAIAKRHNLYVIEDACEAHGALYKDKKVGSLSDISVFSFYGNKIITTGEGGFIATNNKRFNDRARLLRDHAMSSSRRYYHPEVGFNYRLTNIQAAIGLAQLEKIDYFIERKIQIARLYNSLFKDVKIINLPPQEEWAKNVYWMYSILINGGWRNKLIEALKECGIETRPFFIPMNMLPPYRSKQKFPVSDYLSNSGINLPCFAQIKDNEIVYVSKKVINILTKG